MRPFLRALRANLNAGARLACGSSPAPCAFVPGMAQVFALLALAWLAVLVEQRLAAGSGARFWIWGATAGAAKAYVWLVAVAAVAWLSSRPAALPLLIVALGWAALPVWLLALAVDHAASTLTPALDPRWARLWWGGVLGWHCAILWQACALAAPVRWPRRAAATMVYAGGVYLALAVLPEAEMFYVESELPEPLDVEETYYAQDALLARQLTGLRAQDPDAVDLYFIAVGAYAGEDVFMHEIQAVRVIAERELGLGGRVVSLINHGSTRTDVPLASRHNLARAIAGIAEVMDREQDVLLLYLTSHGGEDARLAVEFGDLGLNDLHAGELRAMLDAAGIAWRVVIVSACYSGSFIPVLRSPTTLVMTAAAADRSSFGCGHGSRWTWFGRALFVDALAGGGDFVAIFERARAAVAAREQAEGRQPSEPQLAVGERIAAHLAGWRAPAALSRRTACAGSRSPSCTPR